jgi:twitching motility protein PilT
MDLNGVLLRAVELGSTDVHLKYGQPPVCRIDGDLTPMPDAPALDEAALISVLETIGRRAPEKLQHFHDAGDMDIAYQDGDLPRFRVNAYRQRGAISFAFRVIPKTVPTFEQLNLPPGVQKLANEHRGLILVTGATGSGKTTTLAAMIDYMNPDRGCIVNQREVGLDTESFGQALRRALRQDPDTILIGELRDAETAQTALQAAESGHLVLSTLHTIDAAETVGRMIEFFPPEKQEVIRSIMAGVLRGVISQRLLPKVDGGRVAAVEVMVMNARIADLVREGRADEITDAVAEGEYFQMQTFSQALIDHVLDGRVDGEVAANAATNRHDFLVALEQAAKRKRAAEARPVEQPQQHVAEPEAVPAPTLATVEPDEGLGLRIVPAG